MTAVTLYEATASLGDEEGGRFFVLNGKKGIFAIGGLHTPDLTESLLPVRYGQRRDKTIITYNL